MDKVFIFWGKGSNLCKSNCTNMSKNQKINKKKKKKELILIQIFKTKKNRKKRKRSNNRSRQTDNKTTLI